MKRFFSKEIIGIPVGVLWILIANVNGQEVVVEKESDDDLRIRGVFDSNLPNTERKYALKIILHPHFGDLHRHHYLRIPLGLRYGMSDRWEIAAEGETYFSHGLKSKTIGSEIGFSGIRLSSKYHGNLFRSPEWDEAIGFDYILPMGTPPLELTDGLTHFRPYINFANRLNNHPNLRVFWGLGLDLVGQTSIPGWLRENALADDANLFTAGGVWEGERMSYTLEATYGTTRFIGNADRDFLTVRPGVIWKVPRSYTFNSNGNWVLGLAVRATHGKDGTDLGLSVKARINLDFKK